MIEKVFGKNFAHPWIFAVYYVFFPFIINYQHLLIGAVLKPFLLVSLLASVGFLLFLWITKERFFAAILTSLLLILFFSYPPIYTLSQLISKAIRGGVISFPLTLQISIIWILLAVGLTVWMLLLANKKAPQSLPYLTIALNAASVLLVVISALYLVTKIVQARSTAGFAGRWEQKLTTEITAGEEKSSAKPDIYLIVLDGYASKEVLAGYLRLR